MNKKEREKILIFFSSSDSLNKNYLEYVIFQNICKLIILPSSIFTQLITRIIYFTFFYLITVKDGEINDGSQNKPYYMSHRLKCMLKKNSKKKKLDDWTVVS